MKSKRFTEEQIIGILKQAQAGMKIVDLCRMRKLPCQVDSCKVEFWLFFNMYSAGVRSPSES